MPVVPAGPAAVARRRSSCCAASSAAAWPRRWREPAGPLADEVTDLATEAMEVHLDRRLRSVRSSPTGVGWSRGPPFGVYVHVPFCRVAL